VTAALMNTHIRDNLNALMVVTTKGDLVVATSSVTLTRLAVGSAGRVLVADADATPGVRWSNTNKTASAGTGISVNLTGTVTAAANSDALIDLYITNTFAKSTFTGLDARLVQIDGASAAQSGAGTIAAAYGIYLSPPAIGTINAAIYVTSGIIGIGDDRNANMTTGLTINQGAATDEIQAWKTTGVAHGMTTLTETDTWGTVKARSVSGGIQIDGYSSANPSIAIVIDGNYVTATSTRSTAALAPVYLNAAKKSGTTVGNPGADENLLAIGANFTTRFIFDSDGSAHADVEWIAFDDHDDIELLNALEAEFSVRRKDALRDSFGAWLTERRKALQAGKVVNFYDEGPRAMVNFTRLAMLHTGALRQLGARLEAQVKRLLLLEKKVLQLTA